MNVSEAKKKLIATAEAEIGYREGSGNVTKYAEYIDTNCPTFYNGKKNGYAWCDVFVDYCFIKTFGEDKARELLYQPLRSSGAGCMYSRQYYQQSGAFTKTPEIGAQIFFDYQRDGVEDHTGIVVSIEGNTVITIEGNTSDMVARRTYSKSNSSIAGYGIPKWSSVASISSTTTDSSTTSTNTTTTESAATASSTSTTSAAPTTVTYKASTTYVTVRLPEIAYGNSGNAVKTVQRLLTSLGYDCGDVDGRFGTKTKEATIAFQKKAFPSIPSEWDGEVGPKTWTALLN